MHAFHLGTWRKLCNFISHISSHLPFLLRRQPWQQELALQVGFLRAELGDSRGIQNQVPPHSTDGGGHTGQAGRATAFLFCLSFFKNSVYSCGAMILRMAGDYRQQGASRAAVRSWVFPDSTTTCWGMWEPPSLPSHAPTPRLWALVLALLKSLTDGKESQRWGEFSRTF